MINVQVETAFNQQINAEAYSAYLYLAMAAWLEKQKLPGFAHWMVLQAQEELSHSMILYRYVNDKQGSVSLSGIAPPVTSWENPLACVRAVLSHERLVTRLIKNLVSISQQQGDKAAEEFLQWFVDEQEEEEENASELVTKVENALNSQVAMRLLDQELAGRVFKMPSILRL